MNGARGEVALLAKGGPYRLCLTLGALAELETAFGVTSLQALSARLRALNAADLETVLAALLRGGGEDVAARNITALEASVPDMAHAVADAFERGLG